MPYILRRTIHRTKRSSNADTVLTVYYVWGGSPTWLFWLLGSSPAVWIRRSRNELVHPPSRDVLDSTGVRRQAYSLVILVLYGEQYCSVFGCIKLQLLVSLFHLNPFLSDRTIITTLNIAVHPLLHNRMSSVTTVFQPFHPVTVANSVLSMGVYFETTF
jgi:hypothetical protein